MIFRVIRHSTPSLPSSALLALERAALLLSSLARERPPQLEAYGSAEGGGRRESALARSGGRGREWRVKETRDYETRDRDLSNDTLVDPFGARSDRGGPSHSDQLVSAHLIITQQREGEREREGGLEFFVTRSCG